MRARCKVSRCSDASTAALAVSSSAVERSHVCMAALTSSSSSIFAATLALAPPRAATAGVSLTPAVWVSAAAVRPGSSDAKWRYAQPKCPSTCHTNQPSALSSPQFLSSPSS
jgi:hypothetical protein